MEQTETYSRTFEYKGFKCDIVERPDKYYCKSVFGLNESAQTHFNPPIFFDKDLSFEQVRAACFEMLDGTLKGTFEMYGNTIIITGFDLEIEGKAE